MAKAAVHDIDDLQAVSHSLRHMGENWGDGVAAMHAELDEIGKHLTSSLAVISDRVEEAKMEYLRAQDALADAQANLGNAQSALSACYSSGDKENPPNCSSEESEVDACETDCAEAAVTLQNAEEVLNQTSAIHGEAEELIARCQQDASELRDCLQGETVTLNASIERCCGDLTRAHASLAAYADGSTTEAMRGTSFQSSAGNGAAWLSWKPSKEMVTPDILADRFHIDHETGTALGHLFIREDPTFKKHVDRLRKQLASAQGPMDLHRVQQSMRCHMTGRYAELLATKALAPLGAHVDEQRTEILDSGRSTRLDLVVEKVSQPVLLGRGERVHTPRGGDLAFEVKAGGKDYLFREMDHMCHQAAGHHLAAPASAVLCTRDIHDLPHEEERRLRDQLRAAGSPMIAVLPRKADLDRICGDILRNPHDYGKDGVL